MLVINKLAVSLLPFPGLVTLVQLVFCSLFVATLKFSGVASVDDFIWSKVKVYSVYVLAFSLAVYCNMRSLAKLNVETVIVFRATTPLIVCFLDVAFLGRELPSSRSAAALLTIVFGAVGYVRTDAAFAAGGIAAYGWCFAYVALICFEMVFGKWLVRDIGLTLSGSVWYTNVLALPPMAILASLKGEYAKFTSAEFTVPAISVLFLSCIVGTGISYAGWFCRSQLSATAYTLVGVMNKMLTILLTVSMWDAAHRASATGIAFLALCLVGGAAYKQAPKRKTKKYAAVPLTEKNANDANA